MNRLVIIAAACMLLLPITAFSQTRTRRSVTPKRSTTTTSTAEQAAEIRMAGATKVADQVKILTRFLYLLGGVAKGIEQIDEAAKKNEASPTALQQNEQNKQRETVCGTCAKVSCVEIYFRSTPIAEILSGTCWFSFGRR